MSTFTPEIYKRFGTSVSIDLSSLAEITTVRDGVKDLQTKGAETAVGVKAVDTKVDGVGKAVLDRAASDFLAVSGRFGNIDDKLASLVTTASGIQIKAGGISEEIATASSQLGTQLADLGTAIQTAFSGSEEKAETRHQAVLNAIRDLHRDRPPAQLNNESASVIRNIVELQAALLHRSKAEQKTVDAVKKAIQQSLGETAATSFEDTFNVGGDWKVRSKAFWALHELTERVAATMG